MAREAAALQDSGRNPYIIPEGASTALGALGYVRAMEELVNDIANTLGASNQGCTIIHAAGSGGTGAGLILGAKIFNVNARIAAVNVCDDRDYFVRVIGDICEQAIADYHLDIDFDRRAGHRDHRRLRRPRLCLVAPRRAGAFMRSRPNRGTFPGSGVYRQSVFRHDSGAET